MRRRKDRLPPDKSNAFWLEHFSDFGRRCSRLMITYVPSKDRESKTRPAAEVRRCEKGLAADKHLHFQACTLRLALSDTCTSASDVTQSFLFFILFYLLSIFLIESLNILHKHPGGEDKKKIN